MKEIDLDGLSRSNGKDGNPAYIAYKDRVIDVSSSKLWPGGVHMMRHASGRDLTTEITAAPHGLDVLDRYPQVGILVAQKETEQSTRSFLDAILSRHPFLRRHPHPALVHFPIAFMVAASGFYLLYVLTAVLPFEHTALHSLGAGILLLLPAMATGLFTWWLNYKARPLRQVTVKLYLSVIMLVDSVGVLMWRWFEPGVLNRFNANGVIYLLLVLALAPLALAIGYFGGTLTFPLEKK